MSWAAFVVADSVHNLTDDTRWNIFLSLLVPLNLLLAFGGATIPTLGGRGTLTISFHINEALACRSAQVPYDIISEQTLDQLMQLTTAVGHLLVLFWAGTAGSKHCA